MLRAARGYWAAGILGLAALGLLLTLRWSGPLLSRTPEAIFAAGPFRAGEAFEQTFVAPASYLSRIRVAVIAKSQDSAGPVTLLFRLYAANDIIREGKVSIAKHETGSVTWVDWDFLPLVRSGGGRYRVQVVVGAETAAQIFVMTDLTAGLPGSLISNGIPAEEHIDLTVWLGRSIGWRGVLRALAGGSILRLAGLGLAALVAGLLAGLSLAALRRRWLAAAKFSPGWIAGGTALAALGTVLALRVNAGEPAPELHARVWVEMASVFGVTIAGPLVIVAAMRIHAWERHLWISGLVLTVIAAIAVVLTDPGIGPGELVPFAPGRPPTARWAILGQGPATVLARAAMAFLLSAGLVRSVVKLRAERTGLWRP